MQPKWFTSIILFFSGYAPLFVLLALKDFDFENHCFNHQDMSWSVIGISILSLAFVFVSLKFAFRGQTPIKVISATPKSLDITNYVLPYFFTVFGIDLGKTYDLIALAFLVIIMLFLSMRSRAVFLNPMLVLLGFEYYDIQYKSGNTEGSCICIANASLRKDMQSKVSFISNHLCYWKIDGKE